MAETSVWRVAEGEEARLTPQGPSAPEIRSRGFLPLRVRTESAYRLRPAFPGTAVVLGDRTFEVVAEESVAEDVVVYRLQPWPDERAQYRPFRFLLYPLAGLLPEDPQERLGDRLGLYSVTATLVSGFLRVRLRPGPGLPFHSRRRPLEGKALGPGPARATCSP